MTTLQTLFARARAQHAERLAVVDGERRWTYAELGRRVDALARRLLEAGVAPGDRVAVCEDNTAEFLVAYFAIPWVGAVAQPLNHRLAPAELAALFADAETRLVLAGDRYRDRFEDALALAVEPASGAGPAPVESAPDDLAHLYYTSGTTGRPKGVMLTHRNVCSHAACAVEELQLADEDRWAHVAPLFHLADAWATFALSIVGGVHVMLPRFEPGAALELFARERVSITNLVPTMLTRMVAHPDAEQTDTGALRLLLSGGAPIAPDLVRRLSAVFGCTYAQTYGLTETSPYLTLGLLNDEQRALPEPERIALLARTGRPFAAVDVEVVDEQGRPVPPDDRTVGEIRARGETVSPGYWRRPDATAAVHRDGWFYTGDLAVLDEAGFLRIVDRKADKILTGGENVYSIEVENALSDHPSVLAAAAFGVPDATWGELVCAAVLLVDGAEATQEELAAWCRERIANYKVPRRIAFLDAFPTTGSGKVSKRALRERFG